MSSLTRRMQLRKQRSITNPEDPNYRAPRHEATRKHTGAPFRHVRYLGKPEKPDKYGYHLTKNRCSPNPGEGAGNLWVPHHLRTVKYSPRKRGHKRGWPDGRK